MSKLIKMEIYTKRALGDIDLPVVRYFLQADSVDDGQRKCRGQWALVKVNGKIAFAWNDNRYGLITMEDDGENVIRVLEAFIKHKKYVWQITTDTPPEEFGEGVYYVIEPAQSGTHEFDEPTLQTFRKMSSQVIAEHFHNKPAGKIFPEATKNIRMGKCATCGKEVNHDDFKKEIDRREFKISGMCQKCQDSVFR